MFQLIGIDPDDLQHALFVVKVKAEAGQDINPKSEEFRLIYAAAHRHLETERQLEANLEGKP